MLLVVVLHSPSFLCRKYHTENLYYACCLVLGTVKLNLLPLPGDINVSANSPDQDEYAKPYRNVKCFHKLLNISIGCFILWRNLYL